MPWRWSKPRKQGSIASSDLTGRGVEMVTQALNTRRAALISLLAYDRPIEELRLALAEFEWDCSEPLVSLTRDHILIILGKFLAEELTAEAVEAWADFVEVRDDIEYPDDQVLDAIFVLANPAINGVLDNQLANQLVSKISD
jgi:hypothetical protein